MNTSLRKNYREFSDNRMTITVMQSAIIYEMDFFRYVKYNLFLTQFFAKKCTYSPMTKIGIQLEGNLYPIQIILNLESVIIPGLT